MNTAIDKMFQRTKGQLFFSKTCSGLLGRLLCQLEFEWTDRFPTAAISHNKLYWNPEFYLTLDEDTRVTVLAHELYHNARLHGMRIGNRCPDIWNIAADHVINLDLQANGFYMGGFPYLMDPKYKGWSTEDVYDDLIAPGAPSPNPNGNPMGEDIIPFEGTQAEKADLIATTISAFTAARMAKQAGSIPGETELYIDEFLNPVLPWNVLLYNFFNEMTDQEYSYARPNRRYRDPLMKGLTGFNGLEHLIYYLDVSGSVTDAQILRFNSEVKFIKDEFQPEKLTLVTFDTKIHDIWVFEKDDPFEKLVIVGRGGTDLNDVFAHMKAEAPTAAIIFTDLFVDIPADPGIPIIWTISDNPDAEVPFGKLIHFPQEIN